MTPIWLVSGFIVGADRLLIGLLVSTLWFTALVFFIMAIPTIRRMPLRVYEAGFTGGKEPFRKGLARRETLLPPDCMTKVKVSTRGIGDACYHTLEVAYRDGRGRARTIKDMGMNDSAYARALARILPGAMGRDLVRYLDEQEAARAKAPFSEEAVAYRRSTGLGAVVIFLLLVVALPAFIGLLASGGSSSAGSILLLVMLAVIVPAIAIPAILMAKQTVAWAFYHEAVPSGGSLVFKPPLWTTFFVSARASLPLAEVTEVRRLTATNRIGSQGELRMASGERIKVSSALFERLAHLSQFEADGDALRNRWAGKAAGPPLVALSAARALATTMGCIGVGGGAFYATSALAEATGLDGAGSEGFGAGLMVFVWVLLMLVPILLMVMFIVMGRQRRNARGMVVTEEGIALPNAPEALRDIPRGRIVSITTAVGFASAYTLVRTPDGSVALPWKAAAELRNKGYAVSDKVSQSSGEDMDKTWEASFEADLEHGDGKDTVVAKEAVG